jgi:hypothetical protein
MTPDGRPVPGGPSVNRKALFSVGLGSAAFVCAFFSAFGGFVLAVPAVTCALHARREIKDAQGSNGEDMVAVIGLTMGATTLGLLLLSWVVPLLG